VVVEVVVVGAQEEEAWEFQLRSLQVVVDYGRHTQVVVVEAEDKMDKVGHQPMQAMVGNMAEEVQDRILPQPYQEMVDLVQSDLFGQVAQGIGLALV